MIQRVNPQADFVAIEHKVLDFWEKNNIFQSIPVEKKFFEILLLIVLSVAGLLLLFKFKLILLENKRPNFDLNSNIVCSNNLTGIKMINIFFIIFFI